MQPTASPGKPFRFVRLLAALTMIAGVCALIIQNGREEARYRAAMKAIEESKRSIAEIQQKLLEMQSRK